MLSKLKIFVQWILVPLSILTSANVIAQEEPKLQGLKDDVEFSKLWTGLLRCQTGVFLAADGAISSDYLKFRKYAFGDQDKKGFAVATVDEHLWGLPIIEMLIPTTWAILALRVDAPVGVVKRAVEEHAGKKLVFRKRPPRFVYVGKSYEFSVLKAQDNPNQSLIQCDTNNQ